MKYDVIIVGAGPAGLACAERCASNGVRTLVLERKHVIGQKVCAGGITWNGLLQKVEDLPLRKFSTQHIITPFQSAVITRSSPIIATISREDLGRYMHEKATQAGAEVLMEHLVTGIAENALTATCKTTGKQRKLRYSFLVGADGSTSIVRKYLQIPVAKAGIGINYMVPGHIVDMEWHLVPQLFGSGYGWIFPHRNQCSFGAYADSSVLSAKQLHSNFLVWCQQREINLKDARPAAGIVNFDYRGDSFNNIFLAGDAAGLASGVTGEGIYPAIVSGRKIANTIVKSEHGCEEGEHCNSFQEFRYLLKNNHRHAKMVRFAGKSKILSAILAELSCLALRTGIIDFDSVEMGKHFGKG